MKNIDELHAESERISLSEHKRQTTFVAMKSDDPRKKSAQDALRAAVGNLPGQGRATNVKVNRAGDRVRGDVHLKSGSVHRNAEAVLVEPGADGIVVSQVGGTFMNEAEGSILFESVLWKPGHSATFVAARADFIAWAERKGISIRKFTSNRPGESIDQVSDRGAEPVEFSESPAGYRARERWARRQDEANGGPVDHDDR